MFWDITRSEEIMNGSTTVLLTKPYLRVFHLTVQEIFDFLSDNPIELDERKIWHLTQCRDCRVAAGVPTALKCIIFQFHDDKCFYVRVDEKRARDGIYRDGIRIRPDEEYQQIIWDYLSGYGDVISKRIAQGGYISVRPPE